MSSSINYYNDYESMSQPGLTTSARSMKEKIKLEFSVENSTGKLLGQSYSVQAKLYANQLFKFYSAFFLDSSKISPTKCLTAFLSSEFPEISLKVWPLKLYIFSLFSFFSFPYKLRLSLTFC